VCLGFVLQELWLRHPAYGFVPLPLGALFWLITKDQRLQPPGGGYPVAVLLMASFHLLLALIAFVLFSPFIAGLAVVTAMGVYALACERTHQQDVPRWAFPVLALFLVPPPLMLDERLHQILAGLAARLSQSWLDAVQVLHVIEGTLVVTTERRFFVGDPYSATTAMLLTTCAALVLCSFERRSMRHALAMLVSAAFISIATSVLRICLVIGSLQFWNVDLDQGWARWLLGFVCIGLNLLMIRSADHGWSFLLNFGSVCQKPRDLQDVPMQPINVFWPSRTSIVLALIGFMILLGPSMVARSLPHEVRPPIAAVDGLHMPEQLGSWKRDGNQPVENSWMGNLGLRHQVWLYRQGNLEAYVAVNDPFAGFHDLSLRYTGQGWRFGKPVDVAMPGSKEKTVRYLKMNQPAELTMACLWLCVLDERGIAQTFTAENAMDRLMDRWASRWEPAESTATLVLQVFAIEPDSLSETQSAYTELLASARSILSSALVQRSPAQPKAN
jgi:hypothetical protein